jgi:hypothetical protein
MRFRELVALSENDDMEFVIDRFMTVMTKQSRPSGYWITDTGDVDWIPYWGHHEDLAWGLFSRSEEDGPDEETTAKYGHLFGPEWQGAREELSYVDIALAHGWVRITAGGKGRPIFINYIKGRVARKARDVLMQIVQSMEGTTDEFIFEFTTGAENDHTNNVTVRGVRPALALIRQTSGSG